MRWVVIAVAALLVGLLSYGVAQQDSKTTATAKVQPGEMAPETDTQLPTLGEETTGALTDYRGKVVLVNFWASWCDPCTEELPLLQSAQHELEANGATVVGINSRDNSEDAQDFVDKYGVTFPSLRDGGGSFSEDWGVAQLPESYLIGRDGKIAAVVQGPVTQEFLDKQVIPLARRS